MLTSLSPAFRIEKQLLNRKEKPVDLSLCGSIAILSYIIRPSGWTVAPISRSGEISQNTDQYYNSGRFVSLNKMQFYNTSITVDFHPRKWFLLSIGYNWNLLYYKAFPAYYEINHQIFLHVGIRF